MSTNPYAKFGAERSAVIQCLIDEWEHEDSPEYAEQVFATPFVMRKAISPECPYSFPARTLGDVIDFLARDRSRQYAYHRETGSRLAWYVKAHNIDVHGKESEYERNAALDDAWEKHLETRKGLPVWEHAIEQAQEYYRRDWSSYPGDDQGDWRFAFGGRSSGWLCLQEWRGYKFARMDESEYHDFIAGLIHHYLEGDGKADYLEGFYIGIVCADADFTGEKASANVSYHYGFERQQWEEERGNLADAIESAMRAAAIDVLETYGLELDDSDAFQAQLRDVALLADTVER